MLNIRHNPGLLISGVLHILIMAIPVSMAVQKFEEIEFFVMDEERPVIQKQKIIKRQRVPEIKKVTKEEVRKEEILQRIEEKLLMQKGEIIEPTMISNEKPATLVTVSKPSNPPEAEVRDVISAPQIREVEFGSAEGPKFLHKELPVYPLIARRMGKEGRVILRLTIDEKGRLLNVEVIENAGYGFAEAAIDAVKKSTFMPAKKGGKPVASRAILPIRFELRR